MFARLKQWLQKRKEKKATVKETLNTSQQTNNSTSTFSQIGYLGEKGYNLLLQNNEQIYQALNYHLYNQGYRTSFNLHTTYYWLNETKEDFYPFDFILNGTCNKDKYFNIDLEHINNAPIILIDVKTTTQKQQHFYRSSSEITKIDELLSKYSNVVYLVCLIYIRYFDPTRPFSDFKNWKIRYINYASLKRLQTSCDQKGCSYSYKLDDNYLP